MDEILVYKYCFERYELEEEKIKRTWECYSLYYSESRYVKYKVLSPKGIVLSYKEKYHALDFIRGMIEYKLKESHPIVLLAHKKGYTSSVSLALYIGHIDDIEEISKEDWLEGFKVIKD